MSELTVKSEVAVSSHDIQEVRQLKKLHDQSLDPNLPQDEVDALHEAAKTGDAEKVAQVEHDFTEISPYDAVRAAVRNEDNGEPANTVRAWILGFISITIVSAVNMLLSMRSPAITIPTVVVLLVIYPVGCLCARILPERRFRTFGLEWTFNPGPWNIKEHSVVVLMASVTTGYAYSTDALLALQAKPLYNLDMGWGFSLLFTLSSQVIGLALAGLFRRFLVWPGALIWPRNFSVTTLLYALHDKRRSNPAETNGWSISAYRWFVYLAAASFVWYWFPGVIWQGLAVFSFVTWIRPDNAVINQLFGGFTGLSLIPLTFDWTYVSAYLNNPLLSPTFAHLNTLIGLGIFVIITTIGITYSGALHAEYLPINTSTLFDNTQNQYNVTRIMTPNFEFDPAKYRSYSPIFLAPTFALNYGLSFAALTASLVHIILYNRKEIWYRFRAARDQKADIHLRMMRVYREAPDWWYIALLVISVLLGLATVLSYPAGQLSWWAYFVSCIVALVFVLPCCMILGTTNIQLSLNVISPFLAGFMIPGKPVGVMLFKVYSTIVLGQAQVFAGDLKLAQYMKVPPRITFWSQIVMTIWASVVQIAVMRWALSSIDGVCTADQVSHFTCPNGRTFFSSSIVWGLVGPQRMFGGAGAIYTSFNWFWLLGALLPVAFYTLTRVWKTKRLTFLHAPVMLGAMAWLPPATPLSFSSWAIVGLTFNWWIRKRFSGWWHSFNYITAAALDCGLVISTIIIFFAITLPGASGPSWWGNVDVFETKDALGTAVLKTVKEGEFFGPRVW